MPRNPQGMLPRELYEISPPGKAQFVPRMKASERLKMQRNGPAAAGKVFKFFVSICPIRRIKSIELPDPLDVVESDAAAINLGHPALRVLGRESLLNDSDEREHIKGVSMKVIWAHRSITICTVLQKD